MFSIPIRTETREGTGFASLMQGIVLWPHWSTGGDGNYEMTIEVGEAAVETP
jgi:hypothetical protein